MIKLDSVRCSYDDKLVLDGITLEIGEHLSILGANGSGKSTLAKSICSLVKFDGTISIDGQDIDSLEVNKRAKILSYIPTRLEVYDEFIRVVEFVLLGRFSHKKTYLDYSNKDREIVSDTLEFLHISHLKDCTISSLSSGEQQIVLIAQALTQQSKIIIFDEPTSNLDPLNSKIIAKHIKELKKDHQIILITHDIYLASFMKSPVLFVKDKKANYYEDSIFSDEKLKELYGVEFSNMGVLYE